MAEQGQVVEAASSEVAVPAPSAEVVQVTGVEPPEAMLAERFWGNVDRDGPVPAHCPELGPCWIWTGSRNGEGCQYGVISTGRHRKFFAHRLSLAWALGRSLMGHALHRCDNPPCVNPAHLFEGTHSDNIADMHRKGRHRNSPDPSRTHCANEHEYTPESTYRHPTRGTRVCRVCASEARARYEARTTK